MKTIRAYYEGMNYSNAVVHLASHKEPLCGANHGLDVDWEETDSAASCRYCLKKRRNALSERRIA